MFSAVYRVTQKDFYARPYTSMCAPVVAQQILSLNDIQVIATGLSACEVLISSTASDTLSQISQIWNFSPVHNVLNKLPCKNV